MVWLSAYGLTAPGRVLFAFTCRLPFNIIGELSSTLALVVRLYGNMMSETVIVAILLTITQLIFPIIMQTLACF